MNKIKINTIATILIIFIGTILNSCGNPATETAKEPAATSTETTIYPSKVIPFFDHWKLVLGDGSNAGIANNFEHKDFFLPKMTEKHLGLFTKHLIEEILMELPIIREQNLRKSKNGLQ